jgi:hypothetical protein
MTLFVSGDVLSPAELAQRMLDLHPLSLTGHCLTCGADDCAARQAAMLELRQYRCLPKRRPGNTRPELLGVRRVTALFEAR